MFVSECNHLTFTLFFEPPGGPMLRTFDEGAGTREDVPVNLRVRTIISAFAGNAFIFQENAFPANI
jgi:hypothetical protein